MEGVRRAEDGTHVAGVLQGVQHHIAAARQHFRQRLRVDGAGKQRPLGGLHRREGLHHIRRDLHLPYTQGQFRQVYPRRSHNGADLRPPQQRFLQQLGTVAEEFSPLAAVGRRGRQLPEMGAQRILSAGNNLHRSAAPFSFSGRLIGCICRQQGPASKFAVSVPGFGANGRQFAVPRGKKQAVFPCLSGQI